MDITVLRPAVDGMIEAKVTYYEELNGLGHSAALTVWVPETDSRQALDLTARSAARTFLARCLAAHGD